MPTTKPADADSADAMAFDAPGPLRAAEAVRPRRAVRDVDHAGHPRPRSVEDAGRRRLRHCAGNDRARRCPRVAARGRALRRQPAARLSARRRHRQGPVAPVGVARRGARRGRAHPRVDAAAARGDGDRASRQEIPMDDRAPLPGLGGVVRTRAPAIARARARARDRRRPVRICPCVAPTRSPAARCSAWGPASRSSRPDLPGPSGSPLPPWRCPSPSRPGARVATRRPSAVALAVALVLCSRVAARTLPARALASRGLVGDATPSAISWRRPTRRHPGTRRSCSRTFRGSRGRRFLSSSGRSLRGAAVSTAASPPPACSCRRLLALVIGVAVLARVRSASLRPDAAAPPAVPARRARDRHSAARFLGRARLVRHPHLRPSVAAPLVAVVRRPCAGHVAIRRAAVSRHRAGLPARRSTGRPSRSRSS